MNKIANNGQAIAEADHWDSVYSEAGYNYLSWNAGAARLLVPDIKTQELSHMLSAEHVIVSSGIWKDSYALELLFEDHSTNPFVLYITSSQTDIRLPGSQQRNEFLWLCRKLK